MSEPYDTRLKRLRMRSMRRGIKEMDLILQKFADNCLGSLTGGELERYELLLEESDHDLYAWISGQTKTPEQYGPLIDKICREFMGTARKP